MQSNACSLTTRKAVQKNQIKKKNPAALICTTQMLAVSQLAIATFAKQIHNIGNSKLANVIRPTLAGNIV